VALALAWPWAVLKVLGLGLGLEFSGLGLGLMTCGLINITDFMNTKILSNLSLNAFTDDIKVVIYNIYI